MSLAQCQSQSFPCFIHWKCVPLMAFGQINWEIIISPPLYFLLQTSELIYICCPQYVHGNIIEIRTKMSKNYTMTISVYAELQLIRSSVEKRHFLVKKFHTPQSEEPNSRRQPERRHRFKCECVFCFSSALAGSSCTRCVSRWNLSTLMIFFFSEMRANDF